ncbi:hypothetical protein F66182_10318 [Fusarium sp. NRRL 66182]|nr:hypothetical protein F66182_10318 [Fusarium sp. NRRL 66182]
MKAKDIRIKTVSYGLPLAADACSIWRRNFNTIQAAILRGDTEVTLFDWKEIPDNVWKEMRGTSRDPGQVTTQLFQQIRSATDKDPGDVLARDAQGQIAYENWAGFDLKFIKILNTGGHGYVSLWDVLFDDGSSRKVVIKKGLGASFHPDQEAAYHLRYNGAEHTTQIVDLDAEAVKIQDQMRKEDSSAWVHFRHGTRWDAEALGVVVFEFVSHGDLCQVMNKAVDRRGQFSDRVLWGIWECLVHGVATVAYTPGFKTQGTSFERAMQAATEGDYLWEFFDDLEDRKICNDIHLDMEMLNILVGCSDTHPHQPILKLHDLGAFSFDMDGLWKSLPERGYWCTRMPVKLHGVTPEQIHKEWDEIPIGNDQSKTMELFAGPDLEKGCGVAGRFGIWTNIFLIARIMESVITKVVARFPFQSAPHHSTHGQSAQTYGWMLHRSKFVGTDASLRDIVTQCLYERPKDRPHIVELLRNLEVRKSKGFSESEEAVDQWWGNLFCPQEERPLPAQQPGATANAIQQAAADSLGVLAMQNMGHAEQSPKVLTEELPSTAPVEQQAQSQRGQAQQPQGRWDTAVVAGIGGGEGTIQNPHQAQAQPRDDGNQAAIGAQPIYRIPQRRGAEQGDQSGVDPQPPRTRPRRLTDARNWLAGNHATQHQQQAPNTDPYGFPEAQAGSTQPMSLDTAPPHAAGSPLFPPTHVSESSRGDSAEFSSISIKRVINTSTQQVSGKKTHASASPQRPEQARLALAQGISKPGKISKRPSKGKKFKRRRCPESKVLAAYVQKVLPDMPVAIRNLVTRSQHLDVRLNAGDIPAYAYMR